MRFLLTLTLCLNICFNIVACSSRSVENPAADAQTYTQEEFDEESLNILQGKQAATSGLTLKTNFISFIQVSPEYEIIVPEKIESPDQAQLFQETIQKEIEQIDAFLTKYQGQFRIRSNDGDLKVMTLTRDAYKKITAIRKAWLEALEKIKG